MNYPTRSYPLQPIILTPPHSEQQLLTRCTAIEGLTFSQLEALTRYSIPEQPSKRKGWVGNAIEFALGSNAKNRAAPDFVHLGIELKTIPLNEAGKPAESTFLTSICLHSVHKEQWLTSSCYQKLKRILWVPIEGSKSIEYKQRRIGAPILWSPNAQDLTILKQDWQELTNLIVLGELHSISAHLGTYLQIRPKAANARSLAPAFNSQGEKIATLPRGFYLRTTFTEKIYCARS